LRSILIQGTIAYVSQTAWIQNLTVRENILFGDPLNSAKYEKVLAACSLKQDLEILSDGDQTEIGEKVATRENHYHTLYSNSWFILF
jgi:ABC-type multidrug transport system fused ATPase/permease subunit